MVVFAFQASELSQSKEPSRSIWFQSAKIGAGEALTEALPSCSPRVVGCCWSVNHATISTVYSAQRLNAGSVAKFDGWFLFWPDRGIFFCKELQAGNLS